MLIMVTNCLRIEGLEEWLVFDQLDKNLFLVWFHLWVFNTCDLLKHLSNWSKANIIQGVDQFWVVFRNQVKIALVFRLVFTLNPIGYHFFSHMGWKLNFLVLTKLQTKHHETSHKMLEHKTMMKP
jgi:hypothetical protein